LWILFFILPFGTYSDYRPVINNDGQQVIFERTIAGSGNGFSTGLQT